MSTFQKRTSLLITAVSLVLAGLAGPVGWYLTRENAEQRIVSLAREESGYLLRVHNAINLSGPEAVERAQTPLSPSLPGCLTSLRSMTARAVNSPSHSRHGVRPRWRCCPREVHPATVSPA